LVLVVLAFTWLSNRSMQPAEAPAEATNVAAPAQTPAPAPQPAAPVSAGPVVLTATDAVWIQVKDGTTTLQQGELAAGQSFQVPATAVAPVLTTGKPEALKVMVGSTEAPPVGQPGKTVSGVSLKAADLLRPAETQPATQPSATATQPATPPTRRQSQAATPSQPTAVPATSEAPQTNTATN
jgi:hypothetical protein